MSITDSKYLHKAEKSPTLRMSEMAVQAQKDGKTIYRFGFGQCPFPPPEVVVKALAENAYKCHYTSVQGEVALREAMVVFQSEVSGLSHFTVDAALVGTGSKILIFSLLSAFKRANVLIPSPAWVSYVPQAKLIGHNVVSIETDYERKWKITSETLEKALVELDDDAPAILILNYPCNPTGMSYSASELEVLAAILRKHKALVVADEIYGVLSHEGSYETIARYYPQGTIVSTALSKWCGVGGWRLGGMFFPPEEQTLCTAVIGVASETYSCASTPIQFAAIEAYKSLKAMQPHIDAENAILGIIGRWMALQLNEAGIRTHAPDGGFYLFPDFSGFKKQLAAHGITDCYQLTHTIFEECGVALLPAPDFGMPRDYMAARLAYIDFDGAAAIKLYAVHGSRLDETLLINDASCAKMKEGTMSLCGWVNKLR